jgi:putative nucleotidyltransferase with HDIG domain
MRHLLTAEQQLWVQMSGPDRRHAVGVAKRVAAELGSDASRAVMAAALLHDVGKIDSGLGTWARVLATVVDRREGDGRFARYRRHDAIGAQLLRDAGSDTVTWTWAAEHHMPPQRWTIDPGLAAALKAADDD